MTLKSSGLLERWVVEALEAHNGSAYIVDICKHVWQFHESDLRKSGDEFYTWQYDIRWAGQRLRDDGVLKRKRPGARGPWHLAKR